MSCTHCDHYQDVLNQSYETAIALDEAEGRAHDLRIKLRSTAEALVWCMAQLDPPAWVKVALDEAEAT
jgi:hypothetical protein